METVFDTEHTYHAHSSSPRVINTVVKVKVTVLGIPFEAIIDTGASDTVVSHSVVRKLGLMDKLEHSDVTFVSANGRTESPMGILKELPIGVGNLRLPIDAMVTAADSYDVLVGNDYLRRAQADTCLSTNTLRVQIGLDQCEEIPISETSGSKLIKALAPLPVASPVTIEEADFEAPVDAIQQHFARLSALKEEGIRQQAELEANRRSSAMLMGYVDSSTGSEPQVQPNLTYEGQYEDADDPMPMQQQSEVAVVDPQKYGDMPELVTSGDEDEWDSHADSSAYREGEDDTASLCPVAQISAGSGNTDQELDYLQECMQQIAQSLHKTQAAQESPLHGDIAGLHAALEEPSTMADQISQSTYHRPTALPADPAELYSKMIIYSEMKFDQGLPNSYDLPDHQYVQATLDAAPPKDVSEVRMFLGMSANYDKSVKGYANYKQPRLKLLVKSSKISWEQDYEMLLNT